MKSTPFGNTRKRWKRHESVIKFFVSPVILSLTCNSKCQVLISNSKSHSIVFFKHGGGTRNLRLDLKKRQMPERTNLGFKTKTNKRGEKEKANVPHHPYQDVASIGPYETFPLLQRLSGLEHTLLLVFELEGLTSEPFQKTRCLRSVVHQTLSSSSAPALLAVCFKAFPS